MVAAGLKDVERGIGVWPRGPRGVGDDTLLLVIGGLHGNEPGGVEACRRVLAALEERGTPLAGRFVALAGNVAALRAGQRFLARDMNRLWTDEEIQRARGGAHTDPELGELGQLLEAMDAHLVEGWKRVVLLDLHSTSATGSPFSIMGDTLQNRRVAFALPVPVIVGLEERIDGTLLSYFSELGHTAVCLEGGQIGQPATILHHESAIWITLVSTGLVRRDRVPFLDEHLRRLADASGDLPRVVEIRHRQGVPDDEQFEMRPGYSNFECVEKGEVLAEVARADGQRRVLRTPTGGLLLMPRYQGQGDDGYFIGREVKRFWLAVSAGLRRLRLEWVLPLLPGIRRVPGQRRRLHADGRVARWYVLEILHLFGYRRCSKEGSQLEFMRRLDVL